MSLTKRQKRINEIQLLLPELRKELKLLLVQQQHECKHPYIIGWKSTSSGLIATTGMAACPQCGLADPVTGGHRAVLPPIFVDKQAHWIHREDWCQLFGRNTLSDRFRLLKELGLDKSPQE